MLGWWESVSKCFYSFVFAWDNHTWKIGGREAEVSGQAGPRAVLEEMGNPLSAFSPPPQGNNHRPHLLQRGLWGSWTSKKCGHLLLLCKWLHCVLHSHTVRINLLRLALRGTNVCAPRVARMRSQNVPRKIQVRHQGRLYRGEGRADVVWAVRSSSSERISEKMLASILCWGNWALSGASLQVCGSVCPLEDPKAWGLLASICVLTPSSSCTSHLLVIWLFWQAPASTTALAAPAERCLHTECQVPASMGTSHHRVMCLMVLSPGVRAW